VGAGEQADLDRPADPGRQADLDGLGAACNDERREVAMKRIIWVVIAVAVVVLVLIGHRVYGEARLNADMYRVLMAESPEEGYAAAIELLTTHPDLDSERLGEVVDTLTNSAFENGDINGLVSSLETLRSAPLSERVSDRLAAELHDALVLRTVMSPKEDDVKRADRIAQELLSSKELEPDTYLMMASLRSGVLASEPSRSTQWLTLELAWRAFGLDESADKADETAALDGAIHGLLASVAAQSSIDNALAVADSIGAALNDPTVRSVLNANRYRLTVDSDPGRAVVFAGRLLDAPETIQDWHTINRIGVDIRNRELDYDLALKLSEMALPLARSRSDSQVVLSSIGWAYHLMGEKDEARRSLEASVARLDAAPSLDESAVRRLLDVYEDSGDLDPAIDMLASIVARSVRPEDDARTRLDELVAEAGMKADEIPELIAAHRYSGVTMAPQFEALDASGGTVTLSEYRGTIVLLCFWSFG
jgi:tetratricopeptide (TPR) repeat protein